MFVADPQDVSCRLIDVLYASCRNRIVVVIRVVEHVSDRLKDAHLSVTLHLLVDFQ